MSFIWIILQLFEEKTICYKSLEIYFECSINLFTLKYHKFFQEHSSIKVIIGLNSTCENKHYANNKTLFCMNLDMPIKCLVETIAKINSNFVYKFKNNF